MKIFEIVCHNFGTETIAHQQNLCTEKKLNKTWQMIFYDNRITLNYNFERIVKKLLTGRLTNPNDVFEE